MPRKLTDHKVNGLPETLVIDVLDEPGQGGACHQYSISFGEDAQGKTAMGNVAHINFQNGPIKEAGVNGVTQEALLAITIDRLRSFQKSPFSSKENACALTHCEEALMWLQKRTNDRLARGVEGTNQK